MNKLDQLKQRFEFADLASARFPMHELFADLTLEDDIGAIRNWAIEQGAKVETFDTARRRWQVALTLGTYPQCVEEYVDLYARAEAVTSRFNGVLDSPKKSGVNLGLTLASFTRDLRLTAARLGLRYKERPISDAVDLWQCQARQARLDAVFANIDAAHAPDASAEWHKLATAITDTNCMSTQYVEAVIKSAMWQVKRKLVDDPAYPVHDHIMPVLQGPQGSGKSQLSRLILGPVEDLVAATNFTEITDERNLDLWHYPVLFLDEMENADRSDIEAIKNAITRSTKSGRALYTNSTSTVLVRSSFWGCMNGTIGDKIADPTGMRRFAPVQVKFAPTLENRAADLPLVDWEAVSSIDYSKLWRSVDYRGVHPVTGHAAVRREWVELCEAERQQDSVEVWLRQLVPSKLPAERTHSYTTCGLYEHPEIGYYQWCKANGYAPVSSGKLGKRMLNLSIHAWYPFEPPYRTARGQTHHRKEAVDFFQ